MTFTIIVDVKQKLIKEDFNDDYKMLRHLEVLLQSSTDAKFMRLTKKYYTLSSIDFKSTSAKCSAANFLLDGRTWKSRLDSANNQLTTG